MSIQLLLASLLRFKTASNRELLSAMAAVADEGPSDRLSSALRVLAHAHRVDLIFAAHLQRQPHAFDASWTAEAPALSDLASSVAETDQWYLDYISAVRSDELEEVVDFTFTDGSRGRMSREEMLAHVVTHSGYHRGEAGRLMPEVESTSMRDVFAGYLHREEPQRRSVRCPSPSND
ncbi:DinB family protein [Mangrovicella endophytica]|uniref:DinB family protein n=1 Tax=Mangrovicella endophytica TaxID=2066697 RepID=UPI000C9DC4A7|nr:DinB family protein [Mangrovicella endophytica]